MLYALRFSMAYGGAPRANTEAFHAVDVFLTAFSADAQFLTPVAQLARLLDEDGCTPSGGFGYGMSFFLTTATFEAGIVVVDWALVGLFVATDED